MLFRSTCPPIPGLEGRFRLGRLELLGEGDDAAIIAIGSIAAEAVAASELLAAAGIRTTVAVVSSLRPAPVDDLARLLLRVPAAVTVEEHYPEGGLGSLVAEVAAGQGAACRLVRCGAKYPFPVLIGSSRFLRERNGLSAEGISEAVRAACKGGGA